jgi:hypothetical protein
MERRKLAKDNTKGFTYATRMAEPGGSLEDLIKPKKKRAEKCGLDGSTAREEQGFVSI